MHYPTDRITHTTAFDSQVVEHWLEWEIAQWVHHEGSIRRSIAPWANALTTELHLAPSKVKATGQFLLHSVTTMLSNFWHKRQTITNNTMAFPVEWRVNYMGAILGRDQNVTHFYQLWRDKFKTSERHEWMNECLTTPQHEKQIGYWVSEKGRKGIVCRKRY